MASSDEISCASSDTTSIQEPQECKYLEIIKRDGLSVKTDIFIHMMAEFPDEFDTYIRGVGASERDRIKRRVVRKDPQLAMQFPDCSSKIRKLPDDRIIYKKMASVMVNACLKDFPENTTLDDLENKDWWDVVKINTFIAGITKYYGDKPHTITTMLTRFRNFLNTIYNDTLTDALLKATYRPEITKAHNDLSMKSVAQSIINIHGSPYQDLQKVIDRVLTYKTDKDIIDAESGEILLQFIADLYVVFSARKSEISDDVDRCLAFNENGHITGMLKTRTNLTYPKECVFRGIINKDDAVRMLSLYKQSSGNKTKALAKMPDFVKAIGFNTIKDLRAVGADLAVKHIEQTENDGKAFTGAERLVEIAKQLRHTPARLPPAMYYDRVDNNDGKTIKVNIDELRAKLTSEGLDSATIEIVISKMI